MEVTSRPFASATAYKPDQPSSLAGYAAFLRDHHLSDYVHLQLEATAEIELPMMQHLRDMPMAALIQASTEGARDFLTHISEHRAEEYIQASLARWSRDEMGVIGKLQVGAADITGVNFIRKKVMLALLPRYTTDVAAALSIATEIDRFVHRQETTAFNLLTQFHEEEAAARQQFIERVSAAVPGTLYVFDLTRSTVEYVNDHLPVLMGYTPAEFATMGESLLRQVIHPDDLGKMAEYYRDILSLPDGEVCSHKYRSIHKDGRVLWLRSYDTPFRRKADGTLTHLVGFSFNITPEKEASEALKERESQLLEAQAIARIGSFVQNVESGISRGTPQILELLGITDINDWDTYSSRIHPDDRDAVVSQYRDAMAGEGEYDTTYRYAAPDGQKYLACRGVLERDAAGKPRTFRGTVQDVTEEQTLLLQLAEKEALYREAQNIAKLGSWTYELGAAMTYWSEELLRIYGLDEEAGLKNREQMRQYTAPEDRERVSAELDMTLTNGRSDFDTRYKIVTPAGETKTLHSRGTVKKDEHGKPVRITGTVQDVSDQQVLIDRLAESKARYKEAQALARLGNWSHDLERDIRHWSDEMFRLFGIERTEQAPTPHQFAALLLPADRMRLLRRHKLMRDMPGTFTAEYRVEGGPESLRWIHMRTESVAGPDGRVTSLRGTVQDITQQKEIEQRTQQQETFIRKVTDLAPSVITVFDVKSGTYEFVNEGLHALLGYEADAMLRGGPHFVLERCHPEDLLVLHGFAEKVLSAAASAAAEDLAEAVHEGRYRLRNAEGEYRWIHTYATIFSRTEDGAVEKTLDISLDVTEQVKAEITARENERFVQNVTQLVPSVITVVDVDTGRYVFVNETGASILGQPVKRFLDEGITFINSLAHPDDVPGMTQAFATALQEANRLRAGAPEPVSEMQFRILDADGQYRWMQALSTPFLRKPNGTVQQMITITQDVTQLHRAEDVLRSRAVQLQQSNMALEEFAYVASHDLQEPLRKISTFGEMLKKSGAVADDRGNTYLVKMIDSAKRMQTLINDLLDISVISRQKSFETASLHFLLREVLQTLEHKIEDTGAVVEADRLPDAMVIPAQIRQLFQNLLSNALKFRRPGEPPRITITARSLFAREAQELGLPGHLPYVRIQFADNGIGFSNEYAQKIFTIFQRLHGRSEYEGSGIGLAICKKIAEHHGGMIYATGELGTGSVFTVVLPV